MPELEHGEHTAKKATLIVAGLAALKAVVGIISGSAALLADALHSTVDVLTAFGAWIGLKIARRPANEQFPYGFYRAESIVALFISIVIIIGAVELFLDGIARIQHPETISVAWLAAGVALIASIVSYYLSKIEGEAAEASNSHALKAISIEAMADTLSALVVFAAIVGDAYLHLGWAEGVATVLVAAWVLKIGVETAWGAIRALLDFAPRDAVRAARKVLDAAREQGRILDYKDLRIRQAGPALFGEVTVILGADIDIERANAIARELSERLMEETGAVEFRVYVEHKEPEEKRIIVPVTESGSISPSFASAPRFKEFVVKNGEIIAETEFENENLGKKVRRGLAVAKSVLQRKPFAVVVQNIGEISFHTLRDANVRIYRAEQELTPKDAAIRAAENELQELHQPTVKKE